jgi:regulatory protein
MEPHRTPPHRAQGRRQNTAELDGAWLEKKAVDYAARWETTERAVAQLLERKIAERCERTGEDGESVRLLIANIVERLVEKKFVNDRRAAHQLFERLDRQGRSRAQILARLMAKGVPEEIAEELTPENGPAASSRELRAAWKTARTRRLGPHSRDPARREADRDRQLGILARQGFSSEIAYLVIDAEEAPENP